MQAASGGGEARVLPTPSFERSSVSAFLPFALFSQVFRPVKASRPAPNSFSIFLSRLLSTAMSANATFQGGLAVDTGANHFLLLSFDVRSYDYAGFVTCCPLSFLSSPFIITKSTMLSKNLLMTVLLITNVAFSFLLPLCCPVRPVTYRRLVVFVVRR